MNRIAGSRAEGKHAGHVLQEVTGVAMSNAADDESPSQTEHAANVVASISGKSTAIPLHSAASQKCTVTSGLVASASPQ